ncbi:aldo/keto reductase [Chitinophaga lutea]
MQYTTINGYRISNLTLGTVALGLPYGVSNAEGQPTAEESRAIIAAAYDAGVTCLDTASSYGAAETLIGDYLRAAAPRDLTVITKFRFHTEVINDVEKTLSRVRASVDESREKLGLPRLPVCLFHMDRDLPLERCVELLPEVLATLKAEGRIHLGGISLDDPAEADFFAGHTDIDAVQASVNVFDQRLVRNGMLRRLQRSGKIVFARSIYLQGLFFMRPADLRGNLKEAAGYLDQLARIAAEENMTVAQLAFSYVRDLEGVDSLLFGAHKLQQVAENMRLLEGPPISTRASEQIGRLFSDVPEDIITPRNWKYATI